EKLLQEVAERNANIDAKNKEIAAVQQTAAKLKQQLEQSQAESAGLRKYLAEREKYIADKVRNWLGFGVGNGC
ncbi:hypothetical protein TI04_13110, partial [Achromatium sp. WMS2]